MVAAQSCVPRQEGGIGQQWVQGGVRWIELSKENLPELPFGLERVAWDDVSVCACTGVCAQAGTCVCE